MTTEGAIVSLLKGNSAVTAIVGTRIQPATDTQNISRPKLTFQRINTIRDANTGGFSNDGPSGHAVVSIQIDCWSDSLLSAKQAIAAAREALNGFSGTVSGVQIDSIQVTDEREMPGTLIEGTEKPIQRQLIVIKVQVSE